MHSGSDQRLRVDVQAMLRLVALGALTVALLATGTAQAVLRRHVVGRSLTGRPIVALELGDPRAPRKVLVVGCVHGNEPAGIAVTSRLLRLAVPRGVDLWVVPSFNPDGQHAGTRGNARGVDLNRNFPFRWTQLAGVYYSGRHALSEPESRSAYALIRRLRPAISIWFHQHMDVVDVSGGNSALETRYARLVGLRTASLVRPPGSIVTWENNAFPNGSAFVVELPAGRLTPPAALRFARAIDVIAR
jgi:protein MpaA